MVRTNQSVAGTNDIANINCYPYTSEKRSGIPGQKGVLDMIRGLPDDNLPGSNNKIWHGSVALHFFLFRYYGFEVVASGV